MKKILTLLVVLLVGLGLGGGAGYGAMLLLGPAASAGEESREAPPAFVDAGKILAPLVFSDGRLAGYVEVEFQLEVPADKVDFVTARLPLLFHAVNLRSYKTPLASGPDGLLPDLDAFRKMVMAAAPEAFGKGVVKRIAIMRAPPA